MHRSDDALQTCHCNWLYCAELYRKSGPVDGRASRQVPPIGVAITRRFSRVIRSIQRRNERSKAHRDKRLRITADTGTKADAISHLRSAAFRTTANMNDTLAETNGRAIIYRVTDRSYHVQWKLSVMAGHQSARIRRKTGRKIIRESALHKSFQFLAPTSLLITSPPFKLAAIQLHIPSAATRTNRLGHSATSESLQRPKNEASMMRRKRQEGCSYQMAACWPRAHTHTSRNLHVTSHDTAEKGQS